MKQTLLFLTITLSIVFTSCSKDDDEPKFNYDINTLIGTWEITEVDTGDGYTIWILGATSATFNSDGSYVGKGYFGNGSGTYKAEGNTITCFVDGKEFLKYDVINLASNNCELKMYVEDGTSIKIKCKKK
ncbi:hypothetical protein [Bacteroides nordii]|uniref:hypothetical protein n=1 Tax=Bacteroides nordii TaxID=291645 RepID=UPI00399A2010